MISIDLGKYATNSHRISNIYVVLITKTTLCLSNNKPRRTDCGNTLNKFLRKNLLILYFHMNYWHSEQFHLSAS